MKDICELDVPIEFDVEFVLPEADKDGNAKEGDEPEIWALIGLDPQRFTLRDLVAEAVLENPNPETAEVAAGWLRKIADDIERAGNARNLRMKTG